MMEHISGVRCHLDLGAHSRESLTTLLRSANGVCHSRSEKLHILADAFIATPFAFESRLPAIPDDCLRVCLSSFDCITLIYHLIALAFADSFEEYITRLVQVRYVAGEDQRISNDGESGTILDFACEALLESAVRRGLLQDITSQVSGGQRLLTVRVRLNAFARPREHDPAEAIVRPRFGERAIEATFIPSQALESIDKRAVRSGDLALFTLGAVGRDGAPRPTLIRHAGIVVKQAEEIGFIHATKDFYWRPDNASLLDARATGRFLNDDPRKELIGVGVAGNFAGDQVTTSASGISYFGYDQACPRRLSNYARENFIGVKFLRLCD